MNYKKVFWGVVLVVLGILLILKNTGVIFFSWHAIWQLWPLLLILWGISMIPIKDYLKLIISLVILFGSIGFYYTQKDKLDDGFDIHWKWDKDNDEFITDDDTTGYLGNQVLQESWDSTIRTAVLEFDAAAGAFTLDGTTAQLIEFNKKGTLGTYSMEIEKVGDSSVINMDMHGKGETHLKGHGDKAWVKLNPNPDWIFNLDVGAASLNMDLSNYKVKEFNLDGGASSVEIKLGKLQDVSRINFETGASSIKIMVPKESSCEVKSNTFMTSRHFEGFTKVGKGLYRSDNYNEKQPKIYIELESAISSLEIIRY